MELKSEKLMIMNKKWIPLLFLLIGITACENQPNQFPDFNTQAVYFPIQFPVRTLSLGEDRIDNSLDRELKFHIGVSVGGMYENTRDWTVNYQVDPSLADSLVTLEGDTIFPMPSSYYTLDPEVAYSEGEIIIPSGSFNGLLLVQLEDAFLNDPLAIGNHYVIPLRMTSTSADSILTGIPATENPDKRITADWDANALPKDFTLFMVKYVNALHGSWLHRGTDYTLDTITSAVIDTLHYRERYVVEDQVWKLNTTGRYSVKTNGISNSQSGGTYFQVTFNEQGSVVIDSIPGADSPVLGGSGSYVKEGGEWGGQPKDILYLEYVYNDGEFDHQVYDTLVFRDRGIAYEEFVPVLTGS